MRGIKSSYFGKGMVINMKQKKSKFWTFWLSFMPGAAEMYMGFMKMGLSLMSIFLGTIAIAAILELGPMMFLIAISWFYSFFHARNLATMPEQEFSQLEDDYLLPKGSVKQGGEFLHSYRKTVAYVLIFIGVMLTWRTFLSMLYGVLPYRLYDFMRSIGYRAPQLVVGIAIVYLGVMMIRGKKIQLDNEQDNGNSTMNSQSVDNQHACQQDGYMQNNYQQEAYRHNEYNQDVYQQDLNQQQYQVVDVQEIIDKQGNEN